MRILGVFLMLSSCLGISLGQGKGTPGASTPSGNDAGVDSGTGVHCGQDTTTGATLCLGISTCPDITVSQDTLPGCGFRVTGGATLDIECVCGDMICPVGVATTCDQAKTFMRDQTMQIVCNQTSEGRCVSGTPVKPPSGSGCNQTCYGECAGDPTCIKLCGC